jgi:glycine cleavage system H protein
MQETGLLAPGEANAKTRECVAILLPSGERFGFDNPMSNVPGNLKYTKDHEWLLLGEDGIATIGITDYAQTTLGDVTFVELPKVGDHIAAGASIGVVESVKAASDVYMPLAGTVTAINPSLEDNPAAINSDPYGEGFMVKIRPDNPADAAALLSAEQYKALV